MRLDPVPRAEAHAVVDLRRAPLAPFGCNPMELTDQDISNLVWLTGAAAVGMAIGINRELYAASRQLNRDPHAVVRSN